MPDFNWANRPLYGQNGSFYNAYVFLSAYIFLARAGPYKYHKSLAFYFLSFIK